MTRRPNPAARKPKAASPQARATQVFRAFLRRLERLDARAAQKDAAR